MKLSLFNEKRKSYKLIEVFFTSTHFKMYLNIHDTLNIFFKKSRIPSTGFIQSPSIIHSSHLHYNQKTADKAGDPRSSNILK